MLEWNIKNGDEKLRAEIQRVKNDFDSWFKQTHWSKTYTREKFLSEESPVYHVYYKMTKDFKEIKEKYPYDAKQQCNSCEKYVDQWIETTFSFCNEYGCGISLCKDCVEKIKNDFDKFITT